MTANGVTFKANTRAPREIMNGPQCEAMIRVRTERIKTAAESFGTAKYACNAAPGKNRVHGIVYTPSAHAINSNAKHKSLIKAIRRFRTK